MKKVISMIVAIAMLVTMFSTVINLGTASAASHDYDRALDLALQFFDANKCGPDAAQDNVFSWRGACHTSDKGSSGEDLTGGYHDAGDHVKFGLPQAYSAAMLGWAMYEYKNVIDSTGNTEKLYATLKYFTDYILKCHPNANLFYHQVGDGGADHSYWGAPEKQTGSRPVKVVNSNTPGTDVAGEASAALTIMYLNYKDIDSTYANKCLAAAKTLYALAKSKIGAYDEGNFYRSNAIYDDLAWAATWLYIAGGSTDDSLLAEAETYCVKPKLNAEDPLKHIWTMCWDDVYLPTYVKLAQITGKTIYKDAMKYTFNYWQTLSKTPGGLMYLNNWGALRYASAEAALVFMYNNLVEKDQTLVEKFRTQLDYALGTNPLNMSYVIGYGSKWPKHPHHRAAHPEQGASEAKYQLTGALVGGPSNSDQFSDSVNEYQYTEVAIDYNASFMLALTSYLGTTMASVPTPTKTTTVPTPTKTNSTNGFTVAVDSVEGENGTTVTVPVRFANVPSAGVTAADMTITYDASKLEYVSGEAGSIVTNPTVNYGINKEEDGKLKVLFLDNTMSTGYISQNGIFTTLTFKVVTSSKVSTLVNVEDATFGDKTLSPINATINAGTISLNGGGTIVTPTKTTTVPTPTKTISTTGFTVAVDSVEGESGKTISVPVRFANVPSAGVTAADMTITYDASKLEYVSGEAGSIVTNPTVNYGINKEEDGKLKVLFLDNTMSTGYISQNGIFTNLTFKVVTSSKVSTLINVEDATFGDKTLAPINTTILAGTIALNGGGTIVTPTKTTTVPTPTKTISTTGFTVAVDSVEGESGKTISVPVSFIKVPSTGVTAADMTITYDATKLEYVSGSAGSIVTDPDVNYGINKEENGKLKVLFLDNTMSNGYISQDGVFTNLTFKVITSSKVSTLVNVVDATFGDKTLTPINATILAGTIALNGGGDIVTPTPVKTATPTKTAVVQTPTPIVSSNLKVEFYNTNAQADSNSIYPKFKLTNTGSSAINLSDVKLRYYFTVDGDKEQTFWCDWSPVGSSNVTGTFVKMSPTAKGADQYLEISFSSGAGTLAANTSIEVQGRFAKADWTNYNQADDYSFNSSASSFTSWDKVTAYISGARVWGVEPDNGVTPTPTKVVTPTPTKVVTPTPTKVVTPNPNSMTVKVNTVQAEAGSTVTVPITISKVSSNGLSAADLAIKYDASKLEYVSGEAGSIIINPDVNFGINKEEDGLIKALFLDNTMATEYIREDGVFINLTFKVKSTAAVGTSTEVSIDGSATFGDRELKQIATSLVSGKVEVIDGSAMKLVIGKVSGKAGTEVEVPVTLEGVADGVSAADMTIAYDASKLEYVSGEAGSIVINPDVNFGINKEEDGKLKVLFLDNTMATEYIKEDGVFINLTFKIKSTATGTAAVSNGDVATFGGRSLQQLSVVITDGSVTVGDNPSTPTKTSTTTPVKTPTTTPVKTPVADGFNFIIDTVEGNPGSSVSVPVRFVGVPAEGISAADMAIAYDASKLEYISGDAGSIVTNPTVNFGINKEEDGKLKLLFLDNTMDKGYISQDGIFVTLNFNIKSSVAVGAKAEISVTDTATFGNNKLQPVDATITNGAVKVVKVEDPNGFKVVIATVDGATGSQAVVPVSFVNVPSTGISATDMMITYDAAKIEYVDCEVGSIVTNPVVNFAINKEEDGILRVLFLDNTMATQFISEDGIFASLIFKVIGTDGLATISVGDATFGDKTLKQVDAVLVAGGVNIREASEGFKVSGYINPDFVTTSTTAPIVNAGFTVELVGAAKSAVTDGNGYFEIDGVAAGTYTIKITKANYLTREIASVSVTADKQLSTTSAPILMWAGDMEIGGVQDGAINLEDILEICKSFNTSSTDAKYQVGSDLNRDGAVSLEDVMIVAKHFNKISADY